jgi:hypothetical protein
MPMADLKTKLTEASVDAFLKGVVDDDRCRTARPLSGS